MATAVERISTITDKGQTTVPKPVRDALGVGHGDRIVFRIDADGVTLRRAEESHDDPALELFLAFLAKDMQARPEAIRTLSPALAQRISELIGQTEFDPNEAIEGPVAI